MTRLVYRQLTRFTRFASFLGLAGAGLLLTQCQPGLSTPPAASPLPTPTVAVQTPGPSVPTPTPIAAYDGPALIWPFEAGPAWRVNKGYYVPDELHRDAARYALDLVRVDGQTRGQPALAVADGVVWRKKASIGGLVIRLRKDGALTDYYVEYLHMAGITLSAGDGVTQGQPVGTASDVGEAILPHLQVFVARYVGDTPPLQGNDWAIPLRGQSDSWALWQPVPLTACGRSLPPPLDSRGQEMMNGWLNEVIVPCWTK